MFAIKSMTWALCQQRRTSTYACRKGQPPHQGAAILVVLPMAHTSISLASFMPQHLETRAEFVGGFIAPWWVQCASELILELEGAS